MTKQILLSLLNCSWQWGLLGGLTWLISRRFRRTNSTAHLLWLLFLLSLPILFVLNQFVPAISIGSTSPELTHVQPVSISTLAAQTADLPEISLTESNTQSQGHATTVSKFSFNWTMTNLILCIWTVGTLAMLMRVAFGLYRIHRLRLTATIADDAYQKVCKRLAQELNINRPVTVCFSDRIVSPISFGWLSPYILIPRKLNLEQFELVAAHELAHVQRLDWLTNLFSHLIGAIFFFHPIYHFLNRKLVHLRERICDDWVIQLTGARKNYAQCLLDMVNPKEQSIPLTLGLNEPSELESRINSILKNNRQPDLQPKRRLRVVAVTLLLTCLPLLAMAQLVPLRTVQLSLFAQTSQESEKAVEKVEKKRGEQKKLAETKDKKEYKEDKSIKVLDPSAFNKSQENRLYSGPQPGEKLPPLKVTGISGKIDGKTFDITAKADGKPLVLFLQDTNAVGIKGLVGVSNLLLKVDAFKKRRGKAMGTEKSNQGLQIGVVLLADDLETLPEWASEMLKAEIPNEVLKGISPDGREGPGSYGLNRNVAQTVIIAKDGKVLHNFAFTQPMLYTDPHFLGAIAQAIEVEPATLEKWLNQEMTKKSKEVIKRYERKIAEVNTELVTLKFEVLRDGLKSGRISKEEAAERLKKLDITWEESEALLKKEQDGAKAMNKKQQYENRRQVRIADPKNFSTPEDKQVFSGPQPGEKLPPLKATGIRGAAKGNTFDFIAKVGGQPLVLLLQDESGVGLRGLYDISRMVEKIANESKQKLQMSVVFLSDDPAALKQITRHVPKNVLVGISPDGREGPGNYGLNLNVAQTIIIAKEGKVLHNFAFTQPLLFADPHVLGAIAAVIQEQPETVAKWLNEKPDEDKRMQRDREKMEREGERDPSPEERIRRDGDPKVSPEGRRMEREDKRDPSREELVKRFDKDGDGKLNREEGLAARRALANRENQNRYRNARVEVKDPAEFKKTQKKELFSGPQPGETLPELKVKGINGETKGKTYDVIAKADGQVLVLFLQDESGLGLRGLVGFSRLLTQIAEKSKQTMLMNAVFLGDTPDTLENQASKLIPHISNGVLLGISPDGREGPGSYGLNRSVAQTVIVAKDGKVLHNFAFTQPMLRADPHVLGAIGEAIGVKPATLEKWLNRKTHTIEIKDPTETEKTGKILLNDREVQIDELPSLLLNLPEEQKALLIIESGENVSREQLVKVLNITKKAGIIEYIFPRIARIEKILNSNQSSPSKD
ncbi:MAG: hypothetical protein OXM61_14575 [Candidatus Poribacteria bacterium]|nr:hypothetical protein [Candidatus Poribacteria bacterium]